jgi:hypothetical protein
MNRVAALDATVEWLRLVASLRVRAVTTRLAAR